jgi:hypothetical protein
MSGQLTINPSISVFLSNITLSWSTVATALAVAVITAITYFFLFPYFVTNSALNDIPGPLLAKFTDFSA